MLDYRRGSITTIGALIGQTFKEVRNEGNSLVFVGEVNSFVMEHLQDCCENVELIDIVGDLEDLVGSRIVLAYDATSTEIAPEGVHDDSWTWTFYHLATFKGYVTLRWFGSSNGYYGEGVDVLEITMLG